VKTGNGECGGVPQSAAADVTDVLCIFSASPCGVPKSAATSYEPRISSLIHAQSQTRAKL